MDRVGVGGGVCPPHSLPYTLTTTRRANKLILKSRIGALPPCAGTLFLGFFGRAGSTPGRGVGRTASGGIGPTRHSLERGVPRPRPERDLGDDGGLGLALRPRRATTCLGEGWAARAIHSLRVHKREPRSQQHRWTPRGPAPSRRSITGHGAQKAGAHKLCAHPLARRPRVLVSRQHAVSVPTTLIRGRGRGAGSRLGRL